MNGPRNKPTVTESVQNLFTRYYRKRPDGNRLDATGEAALSRLLDTLNPTDLTEALRQLDWLSRRAFQNGDLEVKKQLERLSGRVRERALAQTEASTQHLESAVRLFGHGPRRAPSSNDKKPRGSVSVSTMFPRRI